MSFSPASIRGLILDMDGVLWRDQNALLDLPAFFRVLEEKQCKFILATNNATRSVQQYQEKLSSFGVTIPADSIVNASMAAGELLREMFPNGGPLFIVGEQGMRDTLAQYGFNHSAEAPQAVVAGLDRTLSYEKLCTAGLLIRSGIPFIGTNPDLTYPSPKGQAPGAGSVLAFLEAASGEKPIIAGKPQPFMFRLAMQRMGLPAGQVLAVGDRLDTDILGAQNAGCWTAGVLTGVSTRQAMEAWQPHIDLILDSLSNLPAVLFR